MQGLNKKSCNKPVAKKNAEMERLIKNNKRIIGEYGSI